ncbi:MAG: DUF1634 domain-containing protein [Deltaproteobacteria bacterium]
MKRMQDDWNDSRVERLVGEFLRVGVIIASVVVLVGGIAYLVRYGAGLPEYRIFSGEPAALRYMPGILADALSLSSRGIIQFGLLLLMLTPVAWVAFLLFAFTRQRDGTYVVVSSVVLIALLFSLISGYLFS